MSKTKAFPIAFFLVVFFGQQAARAYDFSLNAYGPEHVVRGYSIFLQLLVELLEGPRESITYSVSGLPAGSVATIPRLGDLQAWQPQNELLQIDIPASAAVGTYPIVISAESGGEIRQTSHTLRVEALPGPLPRTEASAPPIPRLAEWQANMVSYGANHCDEDTINALGTWPGSVWFYDGIRVYYQIADYTGDASWETCAGYVKNVYRPYVLDNNGGVHGYSVFPHGLYEDHLRTGEAASRDAVVLLAENSAAARKGGGVHPNRARATAYLVHAYRIAQLAGEAEHQNYQRAVAFLLGHFDQWFVSRTETYMQPFMVGLACEALIQYYEESGDPRVPPAIKTALDELWDWAWVSADKSFFYESTGDTSTGAPTLNLLIAPAFAWLYSQTGDPLYRQRGDLVFEGGVEGAWLGGGKQFSQNYRWSFDFVEWRLYPNGRLIFDDDFESGNTNAWD